MRSLGPNRLRLIAASQSPCSVVALLARRTPAVACAAAPAASSSSAAGPSSTSSGSTTGAGPADEEGGIRFVYEPPRRFVLAALRKRRQGPPTSCKPKVDLLVEGNPLGTSPRRLDDLVTQLRADALEALPQVLAAKAAANSRWKMPRVACLSLVLCDDPHIRHLNNTHRGKDAPTDVLSFELDDDLDYRVHLPVKLMGDLVVSLDTAERQAAERGHSLLDECRVLLVHGLLHLAGWDHERGAGEHEAMAGAERALLGALGWRGQGLIAAADAEGQAGEEEAEGAEREREERERKAAAARAEREKGEERGEKGGKKGGGGGMGGAGAGLLWRQMDGTAEEEEEGGGRGPPAPKQGQTQAPAASAGAGGKGKGGGGKGGPQPAPGKQGPPPQQQQQGAKAKPAVAGPGGGGGGGGSGKRSGADGRGPSAAAGPSGRGGGGGGRRGGAARALTLPSAPGGPACTSNRGPLASGPAPALSSSLGRRPLAAPSPLTWVRCCAAAAAGSAGSDATASTSASASTSTTSSTASTATSARRARRTSDIQIVALDLDGTLLNSRSRMLPCSVAAIRAAAAAGVTVVAATGKARPAALAAAAAAGLAEPGLLVWPEGPGVFLQGLAVHGRGGRALSDAALPPAVVEEAFRYSADTGISLVAFLGDTCATTRLTPELEELHYTYYEPLAQVVPSIDALLAGPPVCKMLFMTDPATVSGQLTPYWRARLAAASAGAEVMQAVPSMLEIVPAGVNKWGGVQRLLGHLGLPAGALMAVGDGGNDLEMVAGAGVGVAMGNAVPAVRAAATAVVAGHDDGGVAEAFERFVL
ncbi:hypothetical protein HYH03_012952 [Edaphochlamys debaryana]|uniref:Uncharacterized protein n=1 Tax=Edaphochlamys debaryana TaxID=47281 RepID=A0A835XRP8_9CHLO|nr:hypothetical protein HYH03_012952 [Edaphochlamys debaryana]|eukprot:KAG2488445.1 hypothetical protein HYH03_012952 [Edaphochlamys debaryana]